MANGNQLLTVKTTISSIYVGFFLLCLSFSSIDKLKLLYNLKACAQRFRYALFAFIHTQTYFEYYTLTLRLASLVIKAVIYYSTFAAKMFHIWRHYPRLLGTLYTPITCVHTTRQVCRPAAKTSGKKTTRQKNLLVTFMQTRDMYLHFTRSNIWANGNN